MINIQVVNQQNNFERFNLTLQNTGVYQCDQLPGYFRMSQSQPGKYEYVGTKAKYGPIAEEQLYGFIAQMLSEINQQNKSNRELILAKTLNNSQNPQTETQKPNQINNINGHQNQLNNPQSIPYSHNNNGYQQIQNEHNLQNTLNQNSNQQNQNGAQQYFYQQKEYKGQQNASQRAQQNPNQYSKNCDLLSNQQFENSTSQNYQQPNLGLNFDNQQQTNNGQQRQKQVMTFKEQQILQEIQYYVYQDLANMLGMLAEIQAVFNYFEGSQDQSYISIAINRLVLQSNISNGVHYDCNFNYQNQKETYLREKEYAKQLFKQFCPNLEGYGNQKINECLNLYQKTLSQQGELQQIAPLKIEQQANFNQQTLEKMISGMRTVDQTMQQIQQGQYKKLDNKDIERILNQRRNLTLQKLSENFPKTQMKQEKVKQEVGLFNQITNFVNKIKQEF